MALPTEPKPRAKVARLRDRKKWAATSVLKGVRLSLTSDRSFDSVFEARRSRRAFGPIEIRKTRAFVQHVFSPRKSGKGRLAHLTKKTFVSAGSLHPISVIIIDGPDVDEPILFDDRTKRFLTLPLIDPLGFEEAVLEARQIVPTAEGHILLFVGDERRVSDEYEAPQSLLWRDAGAALQVCSMAAEAYGLAFCPLGFTGAAALESLGPPHGDFRALSLAILGC